MFEYIFRKSYVFDAVFVGKIGFLKKDEKVKSACQWGKKIWKKYEKNSKMKKLLFLFFFVWNALNKEF